MNWGITWKADPRHVDEKEGGLPCLQLLEGRMPAQARPLGALPWAEWAT